MEFKNCRKIEKYIHHNWVSFSFILCTELKLPELVILLFFWKYVDFILLDIFLSCEECLSYTFYSFIRINAIFCLMIMKLIEWWKIFHFNVYAWRFENRNKWNNRYNSKLSKISVYTYLLCSSAESFFRTYAFTAIIFYQ